MRNTAAGKAKAFSGFKTMAWSLLVLVVSGILLIAAAQTQGTIAGRVWNDVNNDGLMDAAEPGVQGVTLSLRRSDTGETLTTVSDATGAFLFAGLPNDSYTFTVSVPQGMLFARYRKEGGDLRSILTGDESGFSRSFVVNSTEPLGAVNVGLVDSAVFKGLAYLDLNYDGSYQEGEPPYAGVTLEVIRNASERSISKMKTGETGAFSLDGIRAGNYRLRAILPDDGSTFSRVPETIGPLMNLFEAREGRRENSVESIDAVNGVEYEFYVGVALGGKIAGTVFEDADYSGTLGKGDRRMSGVTVQLIAADGTIAAETATSGGGAYTFAGVMPGEYTLRFLRATGYTFTKYRPHEDGGNGAKLTQNGVYGETEPFSFTMSETLTGFNAGFVQSASLGGVFFYDENDNGLMDAGEAGFTDGTVRLLSDDGEIDLTQPVSADGTYNFSGVVPTSYTLYYLLPEHAELAKVTDGGNTLTHQGLENAIPDVVLKARQNAVRPPVGAVKLGTFEGVAFDDDNADGAKGEGEAALKGVTVSLKPRGTQDDGAKSVSDADGRFSVTGLRPGEYMLEIGLPDGMIFAADIAASGIATDASDAYSAPIPFATLLSRAENAVGAVRPATLQASVWLDENLSGSQDPGERMLDGLEYALYDEIHQAYVMTARAGGDGMAVFYNVRPSTYTVSFTLPDDARPVAGAGTFTQDGQTMAQRGIAIGEGITVSGISGGLQCTTSIGGTVEADEAAGRTFVPGAEVRLYAEGNPQLLQTAVTDPKGVYRFDGLWPGSYVIEVVRPDGLVFIRPNDPDLEAEDSMISRISDDLGISEPFSLTMAQDQLSHRALLTVPAKVGGLAWLDGNGNGLIDGEEPMIPGVTVNLLQDGAAAYTTATNEWGYYEFPDVYPGAYTLEATAYPELVIAAQAPVLRIISSCLAMGDGSLAASEPFAVTSGSVNSGFHLGYTLREGEAMPQAIVEGANRIWTKPN